MTIINSDGYYKKTVIWSHNRTRSTLGPGKISLKKRWLQCQTQNEQEAIRQRKKESILDHLHVPNKILLKSASSKRG